MTDYVTSWTGSINGYLMHQTSSTTRKPEYITGSSNADYQIFNGPCLVFERDGANSDYLEDVDETRLAQFVTTSMTVLSTMQAAGSGPDQEAIYGWGQYLNGSKFMMAETTTSDEMRLRVNGTPALLAATTHFPSGSAIVYGAQFDSSTVTGSVIVNNQIVTTGSASPLIDSYNRFRMGARAHAATIGNYFSGSIADLFCYNRVLDSVELEGFRRYALNTHFNPENMPNLAFRWRPDYGVSASVDTAYSWTDTVIGLEISSSTEANKPTFVRYENGAFNGTSFLTGSANKTGFHRHITEISNSLYKDNTSGYTIATLYRYETGKNISIAGWGDNNERIILFNISGNENLLYYKYTSASSTNTTLASGLVNQEYYIVIVSDTDDGATDGVKWNVNGVEGSDTNANVPAIPSDGLFVLNSHAGGAGLVPRWDHAASEFILFNRALSFAEMRNLESYFRLKYNITG